MDEFALIQRYFASARRSGDVLTGIGDDCAVVQPPAGRHLVMSIDTMVEGVHFPASAAAEHIGARVMCGALSDLAAMGAQAHWFTLALTVAEADERWLAGFSEGLLSVADAHACCLIGGDTTCGPLTVSVQVHGSVAPGQALLRSGARPGDALYVTGCLGDGAAALAVLQGRLQVDDTAAKYLHQRFYRPMPQLLAGALLAGVASAAIDVSDGLCADLEKICHASSVGAQVDVSRLPIAEIWREQATADECLQWALAGGDDYQLCFTVPQTQMGKVDAWIASGVLDASAIGEITGLSGVSLVNEGRPYQPASRGYNHFG